jgi:hypothetical protein
VYCELTARQVHGPQLEQHLNKVVFKYGKRTSNQHWHTTKIKRPKLGNKKKVAPKCKAVRTLMTTIFLSSARKAICASAVSKRRAAQEKVLKKGASFATYIALLEVNVHHAQLVKEMPLELPQSLIQYLCDSVHTINGDAKVQTCNLKRTDQSVVLGLLEFLAVGLTVDGSCLIQKSPFVARYGPNITQFGKLPNIRARQQTIATRIIKLALVTAAGEPIKALPPCPV